MIPIDVVDISRIQFGATALFHFLFVPLTLGLSWLLIIMEAAYLKTGHIVYKDMTRFWGKLFTINFAMGVVTGVTLEFEFGQNWAYFSRFIGDAFGPALAIEGLSAFMLESTMLGLFLFGWDKMNKQKHFLVTVLLAVGSNLSIVNILVANSWMQHPVATVFDYTTMHLHLTSLLAVYLNDLAQVRIGHVLFGSALSGALFIMGISAFYLLKKRDISFAKRSFAAAAGFGFIAVLGSVYLGDANGLELFKKDPAAMAAIEGEWDTQKAPASWYAVAVSEQEQEKNLYALEIPYALSLIATHSLSGTVKGAKEIMIGNKKRILNGMKAYGALVALRQGDENPRVKNIYEQYKTDLGYGLLLKRYTDKVIDASDMQINKAAKDSIPNIFTVFWSFRVMLVCWGLMFLVIALGFYFCIKNTLEKNRFYLWLTLLSIPLPFIAGEFGWIVSEVGRQPWVVHGVMPTFLGVSSVNVNTVAFSLSGFVLFYSLLFIVELFLMFKYARLGPSSLGEKRYHAENGMRKE